MYPLRASEEGMQRLFIDMVKRADLLSKEPEFYHTIFNTCATSLLDHGNSILEEDISWSKKILLPEESDSILYEYGLIDTGLSLEEARKYYKINDRAMAADQDDDFSEKIRPEIK